MSQKGGGFPLQNMPPGVRFGAPFVTNARAVRAPTRGIRPFRHFQARFRARGAMFTLAKRGRRRSLEMPIAALRCCPTNPGNRVDVFSDVVQ